MSSSLRYGKGINNAFVTPIDNFQYNNIVEYFYNLSKQELYHFTTFQQLG